MTDDSEAIEIAVAHNDIDNVGSESVVGRWLNLSLRLRRRTVL